MTSPAQLRSEGTALEFLVGEAAERRLGPFRESRHRVAVHECAHALCGFLQGREPTRMCINPVAGLPGDTAGFVLHQEGGDVSKAIFVPQRGRISPDRRSAIGALYVGDLDNAAPRWKRLRGRLRVASLRAEDFVALHRDVIRSMAERLLELGDMNRGQISEAILGAMVEARGRRLRELGLAG